MTSDSLGLLSASESLSDEVLMSDRYLKDAGV